jgi:small subunit ribosomal protein S6
MSKKETGELRKYEIMVIVKATLPDQQKKLSLKKIEDLVSEFGGSVSEANIWGKRHMSYPIKKHQEGYYVVYNLEMVPSTTKEFSRLLTINPDVVRFLLRNVKQFEKIAVPSERKQSER